MRFTRYLERWEGATKAIGFWIWKLSHFLEQKGNEITQRKVERPAPKAQQK